MALLGALAALVTGCGGAEDDGTAPHGNMTTGTTSTSGTSTSSTDPDPETPVDPPVQPEGSVVGRHGWLSVAGNRLEDEHGEAVQLRGMSLFWSQWAQNFYNASIVDTLVDDWKATVVRAALGVEPDGYLVNPDAEKARVKVVVDAAIARGVYVIIDWHDHSASQHTAQARSFFTEMAETYGQTPNVIFEIFNEPDGEPWSEVKAYAEDVLGAIRQTGARNVVVVGTPTWSQDVDVAADNPVVGFDNVAYTLHFYAGTHRQFLRDKATTAMNKGLALFVTEWGTCEASGNGGIDLEESQRWLDFMDTHKLSWANWSLFDKEEAASALRPGASPTGGWEESALTDAGKWVREKIRAGASNAP
ncbi:glycoside hydrolase [Chondromyces crocatus]|uniref:Glycoside hydrolase n=2 Tax=Chondromyces crocatus TaxID=52 RepID=A0A0K1EKZ9_CHOCO|nr:glycoside hydrolase [Chondromyces crocatus]